MSWPVTKLYCTKCDFEQGDARAWGPKEYVLPNGVRLPIDWRLGWCRVCDGLAAVEVVSEVTRCEAVREAETELAAFPPMPVLRWWQLHRRFLKGFWRGKVVQWERDRFYIEAKLDDTRDQLELAACRRGRPRCLTCGSTQVIEPIVTNEQPWDDPSYPTSTGFIHPSCGGAMWMIQDGLRIGLKPAVRRYTPEGDFIGQEFVGGYTSPPFEFYLERAISNARARGRKLPEIYANVDLSNLRNGHRPVMDIPGFLRRHAG